MDLNQIAASGYLAAAIVYALLTALIFNRWKHSDRSHVLAVAAATSVVWAISAVALNLGYAPAVLASVLLEWLRGLAWLIALVAIVWDASRQSPTGRITARFLLLLLVLCVTPLSYYALTTDDPLALTATVSGGYLLATLILIATEQVFRNARIESRSGANYFCVAVGGAFLYDLILHVLVIAGTQPAVEYWTARGYVNALLAIPLAVGAWRMLRLSLDVQFPRQIVLHSFVLTILSVYAAVAIAGYHYVQALGGNWSEVGGVVFVVAAIASVAVVLVSATMRARFRVFLMKTFFQFKYDYRKEWLRFISTLSESGLENVAATAVRSIAQIVNAPGGVIWCREQGSDVYSPTGAWRCEVPDVPPVTVDTGFVRFLRDRQWVVDLEEFRKHPEHYEDLELEGWLQDRRNWWLLVPLFLGKRLYGFMLLERPRIVPSLNFEDHDLLRTVGRHAAMHINQAETDKRLLESGQFGAYNRLTAFLMHDLNNLIAQQLLVVENAEKHRHNPKFVDDAIETIANSVARMRRLMEQLKSRSKEPAKQATDLREALTRAVARCQALAPKPSVDVTDQPLPIHGDPDRLTSVFEHLIKNAQDATVADGRIDVGVKALNGTVNVTIADTGVGMSPEFIRERLFRPFDSTKGSGRMGIGAYQARDYVRSLAGQLEVSSREGVGTTFVVRLPLDL